jgi:hypothetical protein
MARKNGNGKRPAGGMQAPYITRGGKGTPKKEKSLADRARKGLGEFAAQRLARGIAPPPIGSVGTHIQAAKALYSLAKKAKQRGPLRSRRK